MRTFRCGPFNPGDQITLDNGIEKSKGFLLPWATSFTVEFLNPYAKEGDDDWLDHFVRLTFEEEGLVGLALTDPTWVTYLKQYEI